MTWRENSCFDQGLFSDGLPPCAATALNVIRMQKGRHRDPQGLSLPRCRANIGHRHGRKIGFNDGGWQGVSTEYLPVVIEPCALEGCSRT